MAITNQEHLKYMRKALEMAEEAYLVNEVPVGCVFVLDGEIVGQGRNRTNISKNGTRHAELVAIDRMIQAGIQDFKQMQLYYMGVATIDLVDVIRFYR
ncbi:tRNA-specific adenosine deaminase 2 [Coemansia sp. RSA 989]|nr:tRNA-specific adenosine deaminase 2 [Coemansia sp. RSA 989]KAJ1869719.1 tRNA-specific adenosine deaminase 2 [Coemansia sp. RSA 990]KAJ2675553.1 tRNA-specific adenosine deaminase 2 [Coemansia sp. RSA 1085]